MPAKGWRDPVKAARDARALEMRTAGATYDEIVAETGIAPARISMLAKQVGLPRRTTADRVVSDETKLKQSRAMKGRTRSPEYRANISKAKLGARNGQWRGDEVGYQAAHVWLRKYFGTPKYCENCNGQNAKSEYFDWAHLPGRGNHSRVREDYIRLCRSCHIRYDRYGVDVARNYPIRLAA